MVCDQINNFNLKPASQLANQAAAFDDIDEDVFENESK